MKEKRQSETAPLLEEKAQIQDEKLRLEEIASKMERELNSKLARIGNIVHDSVIVSMDEKDNEIIKKWWPEGRDEEAEKKRKSEMIEKDGKGVPGMLSHHEVLDRIEGYDQQRGIIIFYYIKWSTHESQELMLPDIVVIS